MQPVAAHPFLPVQAIEELQIAEEKIIFVINYNEIKLQKNDYKKTTNYQPFIPEEKLLQVLHPGVIAMINFGLYFHYKFH